MGAQRGRGRRGGGNKRGASGGTNKVPMPEGDALSVRLIAEPEFHERLARRDCCANEVDDEVADGAQPLPGICLQLAHWNDLPQLLAWFREGCDADAQAELMFSPTLSKHQRALVHQAVEGVGLGVLETISSGFGANRYVSVVKHGAKPRKPPLTEAQQHKQTWLYKWARDADTPVSWDELGERITTNNMTPELSELWSRKSAQQKVVQKLCEAASKGDAEAVKAIAAESPDAITEGIFDVLTSSGPLHLAADAGHVAVLEALLAAGAPVDALDGHKLTALQVSRKSDQSDAEGVLLRAGAADPDADKWPGAKPVPNVSANGQRSSSPLKYGQAGRAATPDSEGSSDSRGHSPEKADAEAADSGAAAATAGAQRPGRGVEGQLPKVSAGEGRSKSPARGSSVTAALTDMAKQAAAGVDKAAQQISAAAGQTPAGKGSAAGGGASPTEVLTDLAKKAAAGVAQTAKEVSSAAQQAAAGVDNAARDISSGAQKVVQDAVQPPAKGNADAQKAATGNQGTQGAGKSADGAAKPASSRKQQQAEKAKAVPQTAEAAIAPARSPPGPKAPKRPDGDQHAHATASKPSQPASAATPSPNAADESTPSYAAVAAEPPASSSSQAQPSSAASAAAATLSKPRPAEGHDAIASSSKAQAARPVADPADPIASAPAILPAKKPPADDLSSSPASNHGAQLPLATSGQAPSTTNAAADSTPSYSAVAAELARDVPEAATTPQAAAHSQGQGKQSSKAAAVPAKPANPIADAPAILPAKHRNPRAQPAATNRPAAPAAHSQITLPTEAAESGATVKPATASGAAASKAAAQGGHAVADAHKPVDPVADAPAVLPAKHPHPEDQSRKGAAPGSKQATVHPPTHHKLSADAPVFMPGSPSRGSAQPANQQFSSSAASPASASIAPTNAADPNTPSYAEVAAEPPSAEPTAFSAAATGSPAAPAGLAKAQLPQKGSATSLASASDSTRSEQGSSSYLASLAGSDVSFGSGGQSVGGKGSAAGQSSRAATPDISSGPAEASQATGSATSGAGASAASPAGQKRPAEASTSPPRSAKRTNAPAPGPRSSGPAQPASPASRAHGGSSPSADDGSADAPATQPAAANSTPAKQTKHASDAAGPSAGKLETAPKRGGEQPSPQSPRAQPGSPSKPPLVKPTFKPNLMSGDQPLSPSAQHAAQPGSPGKAALAGKPTFRPNMPSVTPSSPRAGAQTANVSDLSPLGTASASGTPAERQSSGSTVPAATASKAPQREASSSVNEIQPAEKQPKAAAASWSEAPLGSRPGVEDDNSWSRWAKEQSPSFWLATGAVGVSAVAIGALILSRRQRA